MSDKDESAGRNIAFNRVDAPVKHRSSVQNILIVCDSY